MRLLAYYMAEAIGDTTIADEFKSGLDPHEETSKMLFPGVEITDEFRQKGKTFNFALLYGGGRPTITRQLKVDWGEAGRLLKAFHAARPGISELNRVLLETYQRRGYIRTLWDRRLHPENEHKALNALIQGCAADLMKSALVKVHGGLLIAGTDSHLISTIHDELQIDAALVEVPYLVERVPGWMSDSRIEQVLPVVVDCDITETNWAEKGSYTEWIEKAA